MSRRRSHWGWGYEDRFADREARLAVGRELSMLLGQPLDDAAEPCALDEADLPAPRIDADPTVAGFASTDRRVRATRAHGRAFIDIVRGFRGDFGSAPDIVLQPRDERDVVAALAWADRSEIAVVPYGGGTSVVGGVELNDRERPFVCLDLGKLDRVLEVDALSRAARIQAGASGPALEDQLREHGLTLRFFPQSFELSTLGGWIATRAGGHFATGETHIDDLVESTRMISPSGVFETRRLPASGAGPSPDRLVLGSEGAFGVITEAWVRIRPRVRYRARATARFKEWSDAIGALRTLAQSGLRPSNCRVLDKREAMLNRVAVDGSHVMVLGFESADHPMDAKLDRALAIVADYKGTAERQSAANRKEDAGDEDGGERWKRAFIDAPYLLNSLVSLGVVVDTFETACTWDHFDALHRGIVTEVKDALRRVAGSGLLSCRITHAYPDGVAPYFTFIAPATRGSELSQWREIKRAASDAILAHGGTITHHHAVGRTHAEHYADQRPAAFGDVLRAVKRTVDPNAIMNPGVLGI